jgi:hypothetical protein
MRKALIMLAVGDLILGGPQPDLAFAPAAPVPGATDILIGQGEAPLHCTNESER